MECAVDLFACEMEDETVRSHVRQRLWLAASPIDRSREKEAFLTTVLRDARNVAVRYGRTRVTRQWDTVTHTRSHASGRYSRTPPLGSRSVEGPIHFPEAARARASAEDSIAASTSGSFMMIARNSKNLLALFMFLVIMSAPISAMASAPQPNRPTLICNLE